MAPRNLLPPRWRSSVPFITFVVALGTTVDTLNYSIVVPVFPFRLEALDYRNVSSLVGWLLFIYSAALVGSTPFAAMISERMQNRRSVMIAGQFALLASQLLLMESKTYWMMCLGRLFEGISSAIILTVGLALICDATPEKDIGTQLGYAMMGFPLGSLIGPPVGGALYARWGYRAPFVVAIIFTVLDFIGRVLVVEPKPDLQVGQVDPPSGVDTTTMTVLQANTLNLDTQIQDEQAAQDSAGGMPFDPSGTKPVPDVENLVFATKQELSILGVVLRLLTSVRTLVALSVVFFCSLAFMSAETAITLYLQSTWGLNSTKAGLVILASVVPSLISSPLAGHLSDRFGPGVVAAALLFGGIPWWGALTVQISLAFFIVSYGVEAFFIAAVASPITAELAAITRGMDGVGYAHTYAAFNIIYGLGNAAGSLIGGQIYAHSSHGWAVLCYINVGILSLCLVNILSFTDEKPVLRRWLRGR